MADSLFDIFSNPSTTSGCPPQAAEPPKMELDHEPADDLSGAVDEFLKTVAKPAEEPSKAVAEQPKTADEQPKATEEQVKPAEADIKPMSDVVNPPQPADADAAAVSALAATTGEKPKRKRAPPKPKTAAKKPKAAESGSSKKTPAVAKTKKDRTKKDTSKKGKKDEDKVEEKKKRNPIEGRNPPGYSMLRTESDKLDRIIAGLARKKENRVASGKPVPSVCGMFNDNLLKFFKRVRTNFDQEFEEYMEC